MGVIGKTVWDERELDFGAPEPVMLSCTFKWDGDHYECWDVEYYYKGKYYRRYSELRDALLADGAQEDSIWPEQEIDQYIESTMSDYVNESYHPDMYDDCDEDN